jgi:tRNA-intron endonuclease
MAKAKTKKVKKKTIKKEKITSFKAAISGERVFSSAKESKDLYGKSRFGEIIDGKVYYSLVEAAYLLEKKRIQLFEGKKKLGFDAFLEKAQKLEHNFWTRYRVFRDMRTRGYIVKTALKFGADFRVYERGVKPGEAHAKWVLFPVHETSTFTWHEFAAKNRVAHSTRKNLLIAIVDEEGDVTYYVCEWTRP